RSLKETVHRFEVRFIRKAIQQHGSIQKAARQLKINPATLYRKLQRQSR
ncbi:MAG: hypothetical protein K9K64_10965, partial [Desulfohalobiaceae bacterium]|nr:hypothetical protein [Desulfohalobiaceae bacterium]